MRMNLQEARRTLEMGGTALADKRPARRIPERTRAPAAALTADSVGSAANTLDCSTSKVSQSAIVSL